MTKFEEKLEKLPIKNIEHPVGNTKYYEAVYVKSLIAQVDEEFQELLDKYSNINDNYEKEVIRSSKLESQIVNLKSQLQQQALPVVPECVAEFIENYDDINETSLLYIMKDFVESNHWDVFCEIPDNLKKYGRWDDMLYKAIRFGYTVAKEKRFYLKHKSVLIFDPDSDDSDVDELYLGAGGNFVPYQHLAKIFTQSQIDSMETGSYEQIEVQE